MELNYDLIKEKVLIFTKKEVLNFLETNKEKEFRAFAFDVSGFYGYLKICFETEEHFTKSFKESLNNYDKIADWAKSMSSRENHALECAYNPVE